MNGIEKITGKITEEARKEIEEILANAKEEAKNITFNYEAKAETLRCRIINDGEDQAEEIIRRAKAAAELAARQQMLATKQKMIQKAFDKALEHLLNLPEKEYVNLLGQLAAKAASTGTETVILNEKDHKSFGEQIVKTANELLAKKGSKANLTLAKETRPIQGGLLLKDGDIEVNCTLDSIVSLSKDSLALEVAAALFA